MKAAVVILMLLACLELGYAVRRKSKKFKEYHHVEPSDDPDADHAAFLRKFYPTYDGAVDEHRAKRRAKFERCRERMLTWDPDVTGYAVGLTHFCHWTDEEFAKSLNPLIAANDRTIVEEPSAEETAARFRREVDRAGARLRRQVPASFSWVAQGAVSPVKNQGSCGDCYTFAAAAALEGAYFRMYGKVINLSTQQYTDCTVNYTVASTTSTRTSCRNGVCTTITNTNDKWSISSNGNQGCNGGTARACWYYNNATAPIQSMECYPFTSGTTARAGTCQRSVACNVSVGAASYVNVPANNDTALMQAVNINPVACAIDANSLQAYAGGVFTGVNCTTNTNHAVTVVGYGTLNGVNYWLIKNSWDVTWGQDGYFMLQRGGNLCGILSSCAYPTLAGLGLGKDSGSGSGSGSGNGASLALASPQLGLLLLAATGFVAALYR